MKHIHRFFIRNPLMSGHPVRLDEDDSFHAIRVLKLRTGDDVELADGAGRVFRAVISDDGRWQGKPVEAVPGEELGAARSEAKSNGGLTVAQAIPKGRKIDLVVEKLSEIGVQRLSPVLSSKTVPQGARGWQDRLERWRRIARSAAAQAKRRRVMEVDEPVELAAWLESFAGEVLALVTETAAIRLGEAVDSLAPMDRSFSTAVVADGPAGELALLIGPEAGFSVAELKLLEDAGARFVSLGPLMLRTETAALVAAAVVMHRLGELG